MPALPLLRDPLAVLGALCLGVALAEWACRRRPLRALGSALTVILLAALASNLGLIPTYGHDGGTYDELFGYVAPLGIFWLLLGVDLRHLRSAGRPMLVLFAVGAAGTMAGVWMGLLAVGGPGRFGELGHALGGMFVGTYIGGSANFSAVAIEYGVPQADSGLYVGATVVDAAATMLWMVAGMVLPRLLGARESAVAGRTLSTPDCASRSGSTGATADPDAQLVGPIDLALTVGIGLFALFAAGELAERVAPVLPWLGSKVLVLTLIAIALAQLPPIQRLAGPRPLGMFAVLVFLAAIGALCDVSELARLGALGPPLLIFVGVTVAVHGALVFGAARLLRLDPATASVASQANIGGSTSALALARALGREDLVLPAILVGSAGTAVGNVAGFAMARLLA